MEEPPVFKVKSDLDPFDLYGQSQYEDQSELKSARLKLAVLKAKDKVSDDRFLFDQADHDLERIMELETFNDQQPGHRANNVMKVVVTPKIQDEKEIKLFDAIKDTFSEIFQALIVMLDSKFLFVLQTPNEADKLSKRSREFATRLNRSVFEAKQQVSFYHEMPLQFMLFHSKQFLTFQGAFVKFGQKPHDVARKVEVNQRLHTVLRNFHLILIAYLKHLPLSGGHVYPSSLFKAIEIMRRLTKSARSLGYDDQCSSLAYDLERLSNAAKTFERKFHEVSANLKPSSSPKKEKRKKLDIGMVNNLAKERFGTPNKPRKITNETSLRSNKVFEMRPSAHAKGKESTINSKAPSIEESALDKNCCISPQKSREDVHDHVNSTLMDGVSLGLDHCADMEKEHVMSSATSIKQIRKPSLLMSRSNVVSIKNEIKFQEAIHRNKQTLLDLESDELNEIEEYIRCKNLKELKTPLLHHHYNPVELVAQVADQVVRKVVRNVCHEAVEEDLIQRLIKNELTNAY